MKKTLLGLFLLLLLSGCAKEATTTLSVIRDSTSTSTTDTTTTPKKVSDCETDYEIIDTYLNKKQEIEYDTEETGVTTAKKAFITYTQNTTNRTVQSKDGHYYYTDTHSTFVNRTHSAYFIGNNVSYKDGTDEYIDVTLDEYLDKYGACPMDRALFSFMITEETILDIQKEKIDDCYHLTLTLDCEKSTNNCKIQMKEFGGLKDYPTFASIVVTVDMDEDFKPIKETSLTEYSVDVAVLGKTDCTQELIKLYTVGENIALPER